MDNLCHTLIGAALAESGLRRRSALAGPALIIAANLPDIDVLAIPLGHSLDFRRGHTHGILALALLPFALTGIMWLWHRRRRRRLGEPPFRARALLAMSAIAMLSHAFLDWMNVYGVRWLMPFDGTWFSAESLFIIDLVLWITLGAGVVMSRRMRRHQVRRAERPARVALVVAGAYVALMIAGSAYTRSRISRELAVAGARPDRLVVSPRPVSVLSREVIWRERDVYRFGRAALLSSPMLATIPDTIVVNDAHPAAVAAARTPEGRRFLTWSRLPWFAISEDAGGVVVRMDDARYSRRRPSFGTTVVRLGPPP